MDPDVACSKQDLEFRDEIFATQPTLTILLDAGLPPLHRSIQLLGRTWANWIEETPMSEKIAWATQHFIPTARDWYLNFPCRFPANVFVKSCLSLRIRTNNDPTLFRMEAWDDLFWQQAEQAEKNMQPTAEFGAWEQEQLNLHSAHMVFGYLVDCFVQGEGKMARARTPDVLLAKQRDCIGFYEFQMSKHKPTFYSRIQEKEKKAWLDLWQAWFVEHETTVAHYVAEVCHLPYFHTADGL